MWLHFKASVWFLLLLQLDSNHCWSILFEVYATKTFVMSQRLLPVPEITFILLENLILIKNNTKAYIYIR